MTQQQHPYTSPIGTCPVCKASSVRLYPGKGNRCAACIMAGDEACRPLALQIRKQRNSMQLGKCPQCHADGREIMTFRGKLMCVSCASRITTDEYTRRYYPAPNRFQSVTKRYRTCRTCGRPNILCYLRGLHGYVCPACWAAHLKRREVQARGGTRKPVNTLKHRPQPPQVRRGGNVAKKPPAKPVERIYHVGGGTSTRFSTGRVKRDKKG